MSRLLKGLEMGGVRLGCAVILAIAGLVGLGGMTACAADGEGDRPTAASCEKLRDHLVELRLGGANKAVPGVSKERMAQELAKHRSNLVASLDKRLLPKCQTEMTSDHVACSLKASDSAAIKNCNDQFEGVTQ